MLERRPAPAPAVHDCPLCRALLRVAESIVEAEAAERDGAEQRRATMRVVRPDQAMQRRDAAEVRVQPGRTTQENP